MQHDYVSLLNSTTLAWNATSVSVWEVASVRAVNHYPAVTTISSLVITAVCVSSISGSNSSVDVVSVRLDSLGASVRST